MYGFMLPIIFTLIAFLLIIIVVFKCSYKCSNCGHKFNPNFIDTLGRFNILWEIKLKCPNCKKETWCSLTLNRK